VIFTRNDKELLTSTQGLALGTYSKADEIINLLNELGQSTGTLESTLKSHARYDADHIRQMDSILMLFGKLHDRMEGLEKRLDGIEPKQDAILGSLTALSGQISGGFDGLSELAVTHGENYEMIVRELKTLFAEVAELKPKESSIYAFLHCCFKHESGQVGYQEDVCPVCAAKPQSAPRKKGKARR